MKIKLREALFTPLQEVKLDTDKRSVWLNIIETGTSKNGNVWQRRHLEQMKDMIETYGKKSYADHSDPKKYGRSVLEWVACLSEPKIVEANNKSVLQAKAEVFEHPEAAKAVWERIVKSPEQVGVSVDVMASGKKGKQDNREVFLVEDVIRWASADFVTEASAGGGVERIGEAVIYEEDMGKKLEGIIADYKEMKNFERSINDTVWAFQDLVWEVIRNKEMTAADKKASVITFIDDLKKTFDGLEIPKPVEVDNDNEETKESKSKTKKVGERMEIKTVAELMESSPNLVEAVKKIAVDAYKDEQKVVESSEKMTQLTSENKKLQEEVVTLTEKFTALEKDSKTSKEELEKYKLQEKAISKRQSIEKVIEESKIAKDAVTDEFVNTLLEVSEGEKFEETIKAKISDRKVIWEKALGSKNPKGFGEADIAPSDKKDDKVSHLDEAYKINFGI